jgi:uncharacterized protein
MGEGERGGKKSMPDEHKLPAQSAARALVPTEQSGSLVARGLQAIRTQRFVAAFGLDIEPKKSFGEGVSAERRGDFAEAVKYYRRAADQGSAAAQFHLGWEYCLGRGVPKDYAEAAKWFRLSADQGFDTAETALCGMYSCGEGPPQDAEAINWLHRVAERGLDEAQCALGVMYANGHGVPQD